jgi:hypothetical protein
VAIVTTVAITRTGHVALTEGFQAAFLAGTVIGALGLLTALATLATIGGQGCGLGLLAGDAGLNQ